MSFRRRLGWVFIVFGTLMLISPFIYGFTGYFAAGFTSYLPSPETSFQLPVIFTGFALAVFGYFLARPTAESAVTA